jgi:PGAP1-like protein
MSDTPDAKVRNQIGRPDEKGNMTFDWTLTATSLSDTVLLVAKTNVLPVIFVPGIMGSNLRSTDNSHAAVWRLDTNMGQPAGLLKMYLGKDPGARQKLLHPDRVEVDPAGNVPKYIQGIGNSADLREHGWGEVAEGSYHEFLIWLQEHLNPDEINPALWPDYYQDEATFSAIPKPGDKPKLFPGIKMGFKGQPFGAEKQPFASIMTDDLLKRSKFFMPVYAVGYNWLDSNANAAKNTLKPAIDRIIKSHNGRNLSCEQVLLVTHSMGGLVSRACAQLPGMAEKIAGIVHGVMPAEGAAVAYRRCKVGMSQESFVAGLVIGSTGKEVTAVFSQAPGALQLLPSQNYRKGWLKVVSNTTPHEVQPHTDPYDDIYLCRNKWWGLVNEAWLSPTGGKPITWGDFKDNVIEAKEFHSQISGKYHSHTYAYYGADKAQASFETVTWRMRQGIKPDNQGPSAAKAAELPASQVRMSGTSPEYVGGQTEFIPDYSGVGAGAVYESSYWELHCEMQDEVGDGTVPQSSGAAPLKSGGGNIKQQFRMVGFDHEKSYKNANARKATLYAINKIVGIAKIPA